MEYVAEITKLLNDYFKAKAEGDVNGMWILIYDPYGTEEEDFKKKTQKEVDDYSKSNYKPSYTLVSIDSVDEKNESGDVRWKGCNFAKITYKQGNWEKKEEIAVLIKEGQAYLNYCKRI